MGILSTHLRFSAAAFSTSSGLFAGDGSYRLVPDNLSGVFDSLGFTRIL